MSMLKGLRRRVKKGVELLSPAPQENILDVGCASGYVCEALLEIGVNPTGIDLDREALKRGKVRTRELSLVNADASFLPFRAAAFDKILCLETLEHVEDDRSAICEISRVLKDRRTLIISVPNNICLLNFLDPCYTLWKMSRENSKMHRHYSREHLKRMLKTAGLNIRRSKTYGFINYAMLRWLLALGRRTKFLPSRVYKILNVLAEREFTRSNKFGFTLFVICDKKRTLP